MGWSVPVGFLGDLIDRGEDSRKVIELVKDFVEQQGHLPLW
ncbi:MAG: hypothetical protein ACLRSL_00710 [Streptococcus sp.]